MSFLMSNVYAAAATIPSSSPAGQADSAFSLAMIVGIFVLIYLMLIRPQNKRAKEHRDLITQLKKGDEIITSGGVVGKVTHLDEQFIKLSISDGIEVHIQRTAVSSVLPKGTIKAL